MAGQIVSGSVLRGWFAVKAQTRARPLGTEILHLFELLQDLLRGAAGAALMV
jgi:hypothetical protein